MPSLCRSFVLFLLGHALPAATGILLYPVMERGRVEIKAGSIVEFSEDRGMQRRIRYQGQELTGYAHVIPLDSHFAPYRIFLELQPDALAHSDIATQALAAKVDLADAALKALKGSPLLEDIEAQDVRLTYQLSNSRTDGKMTATDALTKARRYLVHYPRGKYRDELEWDIVLWSNEVYEIEGQAGIPLHQARAYERFYAAHSESAYAEEIQERMANAFRLAGDLLDYGPGAKHPGPGTVYRRKAERLYDALLVSKDQVRTARARVALYNLHHGRVPGFGTPASPPLDW